MSFTIGSLFDGSGGFPLAATMCGGTPKWASEIEPYPIAVTTSRFPNVKHLGSVTDINGGEVEPVDVITFGSPCQDLSVAGKRAGLKHEANGDEETTRSGLFMEAVRIIKEMREATNGVYPRFALWENVPGAFSSNKGEDFRIVLEELIKVVEPTAVMPPVPKKGWPYADSYCGDGWSIAYRVLDAQFWGVPQRRRRIYLVADFRGECAGKVSFEREGLRGYFETGRTPWQTVAGDAEGGSGAADCTGVGLDIYNLAVTGDVAASLTTATGQGASNTGPSVIAVDQGGGKSGANFHDNLSPTLTCTHGWEPAVAYAIDQQGGKGALIQEDMSATLATNNDQYLFQPITLEPGIAAREGGHIYEGVSGTLRANAGDNQMAVAYADMVLDDQGGSQISVRNDGKCPTLRAEMHGNIPSVMEPMTYDARGNDDGKVTSTITGGHESSISDFTSVVLEPVYCLQGNGIDRADTAGCNGKGVKEDICYTLNTIDRPAVAFQTYQKVTGPLMANSHPGSYTGQDAFSDMLVAGKEETPVVFDRAFYNQGKNAQYEPQTYEDGTVPTVVARVPSAVCYEKPPRYIVRRLTPTECARLQGFPDYWGHPDRKEDFTEEEVAFWNEVRNVHAAINGKPTKDYTKAQLLTWYNKLHTDSAEYKMWGNGIALPPALYVMQGIKDALEAANELDQR